MIIMNNRQSEPSAGRSAADIVFWAVALFILFWALGDRSLWGSEDRWAEVTREMFLTKDFFHPRINGEPYFDKPLLGYWFIALVSGLTGSLNEWSVRAPSAVSGLLALWATVYLGRKLWSDRVGRTAGWILLTTYGMLFWARLGEADMANLAAIALAVAWYWSRRDSENFFAYLVFYLICFIGAHTKGLTAVVIPFVAVFPDLLRERRWRSHLNPANFLAMALCAVIYLAPFAYAAMTREGYHSSGLALVLQENIQRFFSPLDHVEPFYIYLYCLPELFLPWTPLLLAAFLGVFASWRHLDRNTRWLAEAIILIFLFFTASGSRRVYYILPILPFCALLTSWFLMAEGKERLKKIAIGIQITVFALVALAGVLSPAIWPIIKRRMGFVPTMDLMVTTPMLGFLALVIFALWWLRPALLANFTWTDQRIAGLLGAAAILMGGFFCWQYVSLDAYRTEKPFARELKNHITGIAEKEIAAYREVRANILFYLDLPEPVLVLRDPGSVQRFLKSSKGTKVLVSQRRDLNDVLPELQYRLRKQPSLSEKVYPWVDSSNRKLVVWTIDEDRG
jgi:4-amino-4-deoxy-L-arabinose transferase-like glycosyltransferase